MGRDEQQAAQGWGCGVTGRTLRVGGRLARRSDRPGSFGRALGFALVVLAAAAGSALAASAAACAQGASARRVVVQRFRGPRGSAVRRALIRDLEDNGVVVVDESEVRAARSRLGFGRSLDSEQYVALARELNVAAFLDGRVRRARRRWAATVRVRDASTGEELGSESWGGRTAASLSAVGRSGYRRLSSYLEQSVSPAAPPPAEPDPNAWYNRQDEEVPPELEEEEPEEQAPTDPSSRYDAFRIAVGGGTLYRSMSTMVEVYAAQRGRAPADPSRETLEEERRYQSGGIGHLELGGLAELYPGAFGDQPFPYLGVVFSFSHSAAVQSNGRDRNTGDPVTVPTDQLDLYIGARGRYRLGEARREPEFHVDVGWGMFQFNLGLAELQILELDTVIPPMQHGYLQLAAGFSYGLVPTYLTIVLDVGYRIGTNTGVDTRNVWGTDTGPSNGVLASLEARVEIPEIVQGFFLALKLAYFHFVTDFQGQVGCAVVDGCSAYVHPWEDSRLWEVWPVDPPPPGTRADLNDVVGGPRSGVEDHYFRLQVQVGYQFY